MAMTIRHATETDIAAIARVEAAAFPAAEAASEESIARRVAVFPDCFWLLEKDGQLFSFINGMATNEETLTDEMFEHAEMHDPAGEWQMLFSVATDPEKQHCGYASRVMEKVIEDCRNRGHKGIILTCKDRLVGFYERFGYVKEGLSVSTHGGAVWYQMRLVF